MTPKLRTQVCETLSGLDVARLPCILIGSCVIVLLCGPVEQGASTVSSDERKEALRDQMLVDRNNAGLVALYRSCFWRDP